MKTLRILLVLIVITGITYYQLDRQLFYFGKSNLQIYNTLPINIKPDYRASFEGGFALRDDYGFTIAAKGNTYPVNGKAILIDKVLKYEFNNSTLIAIVADIKRNKYYVQFHQDKKDKSIIKANMATIDKFHSVKLGKWVDIDGNDNYIWRIVIVRNYLLYIVIILIVILIYKISRYKK